MRLLFVSPLPPAHSGVADFSAGLAVSLGERLEVDACEAPTADQLASADRRLYQIGNNSLHAAAYDAALRSPGVVELHDAVLHHFHLGRLSREDYVEEVVYNEGEWARGEAGRLWERRGHAETDEAFFQVAPADQQLRHLRGHEWIVLQGLDAELPVIELALADPEASPTAVAAPGS